MNNYDVIIFGGGTAGCACAWNCSKLGLKTLLIEKENNLGGTITNALVIPVMNSGNNQINTDFYNELIIQMHKAGGQITYQNNPGWFNPFIINDVLIQMLEIAGVEVVFNLPMIRRSFAITQDDKINKKFLSSTCGSGLSTKMLSSSIDTIHTDNITHKIITQLTMLSVPIGAKYFVDATGDLELCQKLNCEFLPQTQPLPPKSLRFIMDGVDLDAFGNWLLKIDSDKDVTTVEHIDGQTHLSTAYTWDSDKHWALAPYFDKAVEVGDLKDTDCNYFQVFTVAGMPSGLAFNCPRLINGENYEQAIEIIQRLAAFCKKYFVGFENAEIYKIADKLGVRASNRIKGKYIYTINDLRSGKKFEHLAVISNYPIDVHSSQKNASTLEKTGEYQLPIESLMSADYDNLFVAGRGLSADEMAQGALRVQASCFAMGEAVAKYLAGAL